MTALPLSSLFQCWAAQSKRHFPKQLIKFMGSPGEGSEAHSNPQASTLMKEKTSTAHTLIWVAGMMTDLSNTSVYK